MVEVGELQRIAEEKHRGVIAHEIPVALIGIEFHRKTTDIPLGICGTTFSCYSGETEKAVSFFPFFAKILAFVYFVISWVTVKVP